MAAGLDKSGVDIIEISHGDGIAGSSINYGFSETPELELIRAAREVVKTSKLGVLLLLGIGTIDDLKEAHEAGAEYVDCCCRGLGAGAGNTQTEVLCAVLQRMGYNTGVTLYDIQDVAEDLVEPIMRRPQVIRTDSIL
ncbi:MAG: hypothetical protein E7220_08815 [Clostridiales bacterium]|nr:hypothetical protein [Clostridiales bacterium]